MLPGAARMRAVDRNNDRLSGEVSATGLVEGRGAEGERGVNAGVAQGLLESSPESSGSSALDLAILACEVCGRVTTVVPKLEGFTDEALVAAMR